MATGKSVKRPPIVAEDPPVISEKGVGFLFWGLLVVFALNLVMVIGALVLFGP